jgi:hypothetical protein
MARLGRAREGRAGEGRAGEGRAWPGTAGEWQGTADHGRVEKDSAGATAGCGPRPAATAVLRLPAASIPRGGGLTAPVGPGAGSARAGAGTALRCQAHHHPARAPAPASMPRSTPSRASPLSDGALRHKRATPAMSGNGRRAKISTKFTTFLLCGMAAHRRVNSPCALVQWVRKLLNFPFPSLGPALGPFAAARAERWSMGSRSADRATGTVVGGAFVVLAPTGVKALNRWTDGCNHRLGELAYVWMVHGSRFGFATTLRRFGVPFGPGLEPRFLGAHHPPSERSLQRRVPFGARPGVTLAPGKGAARRGRGRKSRKSCR